jgi:hypothetical protein
MFLFVWILASCCNKNFERSGSKVKTIAPTIAIKSNNPQNKKERSDI